jgi:hypothetical protein
LTTADACRIVPAYGEALMDLVDLFWNLRQQQQIAAATVRAATASADAEEHRASLDDLNRRFERLALVTQSVWEVLAERLQLSEDTLLAKLHEVDARDGARDGRVSTGTRACPKCHRPSPGARTTCLYCGATLGPSRPFEGL